MRENNTVNQLRGRESRLIETELFFKKKIETALGNSMVAKRSNNLISLPYSSVEVDIYQISDSEIQMKIKREILGSGCLIA
jgi:hypothetical protein